MVGFSIPASQRRYVFIYVCTCTQHTKKNDNNVFFLFVVFRAAFAQHFPTCSNLVPSRNGHHTKILDQIGAGGAPPTGDQIGAGGKVLCNGFFRAANLVPSRNGHHTKILDRFEFKLMYILQHHTYIHYIHVHVNT